MAVLSGLVMAFFAVLELREPLFFLWDDNASFYLPAYVYNDETVIGRGELPHLNYHQYLGHTYLASGQTAVLYAPLYPALVLTRLVWDDLLPIVDVMAVLHLVLAALGMFFLLRRLGASRAVTVGVSCLWVSFPFLVVVSRSWVFVAYTAAFLPWSLWLVDRLFERPTTARVLALAAVKALFIYQGYVQYVILGGLVEAFYVALRFFAPGGERTDFRRRATAYLAALAAAGFLAAPLLVPMYYAKEVSAYRTASLSFDEFLSNALELGTFVKAQGLAFEPGAVHLSSSAIFYFGLPNLLALAALLAAGRRRLFLPAVAAALLALLLSTRTWGLLYHAPLLSSFRWPFKSFLIFLFFATVALAGAYEALWSSPRRGWRALAVLGLAAGLAVNVYVSLSPRLAAPFGPNRIDESVAEVRADAAKRFPLDQGRVISLWMSPVQPGIHRFLIFNYATLVRAFHLGGYDPLIAAENLELAKNLEYSNIFRYELTPQALAYLSSWSVRYLMVPERPEYQPMFARHPQLRLQYRGEGIEVWENEAALPLAYFVEPSALTPVAVDWGPQGVGLATGGRGGILRVGIAPLGWYEWSADGEVMGAVSYDRERHVFLEVPDGVEQVEIRYVDVPFRIGTGLFLVFLLSIGAVQARRRFAGKTS